MASHKPVTGHPVHLFSTGHWSCPANSRPFPRSGNRVGSTMLCRNPRSTQLLRHRLLNRLSKPGLALSGIKNLLTYMTTQYGLRGSGVPDTIDPLEPDELPWRAPFGEMDVPRWPDRVFPNQEHNSLYAELKPNEQVLALFTEYALETKFLRLLLQETTLDTGYPRVGAQNKGGWSIWVGISNDASIC